VKVGGERLYRLARRGEDVERPVREVVVHSARLTDGPDAAGVARIEVTVSKGTYIRSLAADLGDALGCGGYCVALRRTRVGDLRVEDAVAPEDVRAEGGIGLARALAHLPARALSPEEAIAVGHGRPVTGGERGTVALLDGERLAAVATGDGAALRPEVVMPRAA
jgi:tRNA pseudouridine55 synthase